MSSTVSPNGIPRLTREQTNYSYFRSRHLVPNQPCIFDRSLVCPRDVDDDEDDDDGSSRVGWTLFDKWFVERQTGRVEDADDEEELLDWDYLETQYGSLSVESIDCENGSHVPGEEEERREEEGHVSTFGQLIDLWRHGRGRSKYLKDWHLPLEIQRRTMRADAPSRREAKERLRDELYRVETVCLDDWMNEFECNDRQGRGKGKGDDFRFVYAGGQNTFTPLHRDVYCSYSISTQIYGRKLWYLFPPACTPLLEPLIKRANYQGTSINCQDWTDDLQKAFTKKGMLKIWQQAKETIFIPSGWYHSVHNLDHPTLSLNHNWLNAHNLAAVYSSLSGEVARCREAISDVKDLIVENFAAKRNRREDNKNEDDDDDDDDDGPNAWKREWEREVDQLVERSEGWSWTTFWNMVANTLESLEVSRQVLETRFEGSRWPVIPPEARPPTAYTLEQLVPLVRDFRQRPEQEWKWLEGLDATLDRVEDEMARLTSSLRGRSEHETR